MFTYIYPLSTCGVCFGYRDIGTHAEPTRRPLENTIRNGPTVTLFVFKIAIHK
jgi:hypothetical protein